MLFYSKFSSFYLWPPLSVFLHGLPSTFQVNVILLTWCTVVDCNAVSTCEQLYHCTCWTKVEQVILGAGVSWWWLQIFQNGMCDVLYAMTVGAVKGLSVLPGVFLANVENKTHFIALLSRHLKSAGIAVLPCFWRCRYFDSINISWNVKERTPVMWEAQTSWSSYLFPDAQTDAHMLIPENKNTDHKVIITEKLRVCLADLSILIFFHAAIRCDTTFARITATENHFPCSVWLWY